MKYWVLSSKCTDIQLKDVCMWSHLNKLQSHQKSNCRYNCLSNAADACAVIFMPLCMNLCNLLKTLILYILPVYFYVVVELSWWYNTISCCFFVFVLLLLMILSFFFSLLELCLANTFMLFCWHQKLSQCLCTCWYHWQCFFSLSLGDVFVLHIVTVSALFSDFCERVIKLEDFSLLVWSGQVW